jgi:hypothetical protein
VNEKNYSFNSFATNDIRGPRFTDAHRANSLMFVTENGRRVDRQPFIGHSKERRRWAQLFLPGPHGLARSLNGRAPQASDGRHLVQPLCVVQTAERSNADVKMQRPATDVVYRPHAPDAALAMFCDESREPLGGVPPISFGAR